MLFGGIFLYAAYYGCDQSQAQRILATKSPQETGKVLVLNGLFRFPLVLLYCFLGLGLAIFSLQDAQLIDSLPLLESGKRNYNLVFPQFVSQNFSPGLVGLVLVGLVAAAMSSIDSALNSLAAVTVEDFIKPKLKNQTSGKDLLLYGRICTIFWAIFAIAFSFYVEDIAPTVLEAVNKIGSMVNGPILALVTIAILAGKRARESFALIGFWCGLVSNFLTAYLLPDVSWLWWNVIGFCVSILSFYSLEKLLPRDLANFDLVSSVISGFGSKGVKNDHVIVLALMFSFVLAICLLLNKF
jgi:SSS family solute:Na+ symporter